jgi:hypothetical protein
MDKTHLDLAVWFWAIYLIAKDKRGCSAAHVSRELELPYNTAWFLVHRIRRAMSNREEEYALCHIVEMDDTYFGIKRKGGKRGRGTTKHKVLVALVQNGMSQKALPSRRWAVFWTNRPNRLYPFLLARLKP